MAKNKSVKKLKQNDNKIPTVATELRDKTNYNELNPVFKFGNADPNKWNLCEWQKEELKALMRCFKKMEELKWCEVKVDTGLKFTKLKDINPPHYLSNDIDLYEVRVSKEQRVHGFISGNVFNVVWFDRDHTVCPEGKQRRYG